jgi:hypothetical protein
MTPTTRVRLIVGEDDGRRYVLARLDGEPGFDGPARMACDHIVADQIVTVPLARGAAANGGE